MSPTRTWAVLIGILLITLGAGLLGYFIGDHYATLAVADEQCPLYTDYSRPFCQALQNRMDSDWWAAYAGDVLIPVGALAIMMAFVAGRTRSPVRPPGVSNPGFR